MSAEQNLREKMAAAQVLPRSVRSVLRVRVVSLETNVNGEDGGKHEERSALLSWWQPDEELLSVFVEGRALSLFNINPGNSRYVYSYHFFDVTFVTDSQAPNDPMIVS